jgi:hypothetical protein
LSYIARVAELRCKLVTAAFSSACCCSCCWLSAQLTRSNLWLNNTGTTLLRQQGSKSAAGSKSEAKSAKKGSKSDAKTDRKLSSGKASAQSSPSSKSSKATAKQTDGKAVGKKRPSTSSSPPGSPKKKKAKTGMYSVRNAYTVTYSSACMTTTCLLLSSVLRCTTERHAFVQVVAERCLCSTCYHSCLFVLLLAAVRSLALLLLLLLIHIAINAATTVATGAILLPDEDAKAAPKTGKKAAAASTAAGASPAATSAKKTRLPMSGLLMFSNAKKAAVRRALGGADVTPEQVTAEVRRQWQELSAEQQQPYKAKADAVVAERAEVRAHCSAAAVADYCC